MKRQKELEIMRKKIEEQEAKRKLEEE